jgi:hypothetical protein
MSKAVAPYPKIITQAKRAIQTNLSLVQRRLHDCTLERDELQSRLDGYEIRAEVAEKAQRDMARELARLKIENERLRAEAASR